MASFLDENACPGAAVIKPIVTIPIGHTKEATCSTFSEDGSWLAVGCNDSTIEIYKVEGGKHSFTLCKSGADKYPCTSVCFRPTAGVFVTKNVLISGDVGGQVHQWHVTSGKHISAVKESENEVYTLAHQRTGHLFATAGLDAKIRIYDGKTRELCNTLKDGDGTSTIGHTNRIFCVKWNPIDINVLLSGGWDSTLQIWDLRTGQSVRSIFGPKLCGDSLDMRNTGNKILTGSWRGCEQLQEWDYGSGKLIQTMFWPQKYSAQKPCQVYAACYGRNISENVVAAGGSGANEACIFHSEHGKFLAGLHELEKGVVSISFNNVGNQMAVVTLKRVYMVDVQCISKRLCYN